MSAQVGFGFGSRAPAAPDSVRLLLGDVREAIGLGIDVGLVHADPPWSYSAGVPGNGKQDDHYAGLPMATIAEHVDGAFDAAGPDCYLVLWCTWPMLARWVDAFSGGRWGYVSGGSWIKYRIVGRSLEYGVPGIGYHWRGNSEPVLLYRKGNPKPLGMVRNAHVDLLDVVAPRGRHSEKPVEYLERLLGAFCAPGSEVLDLYSGLAPLARACVSTGRRYLGAEIDADRHAAALSLLAQHRGPSL